MRSCEEEIRLRWRLRARFMGELLLLLTTLVVELMLWCEGRWRFLLGAFLGLIC